MQVEANLIHLDRTLVYSNDVHVVAGEEAFAGIRKRFDGEVLHERSAKAPTCWR